MVIKDTVKHRTSTCLNLHVISGGAMDSKSTSGLEDEEYSSQNRIFQSVGLVSTACSQQDKSLGDEVGSVATEQMSPASKQSSVNTANDNGNENLQRVKESSSVDTKTGIISRRSSTSRRDVLMSPKSDAIVECTNVAHNATPSTPTYRQQMLSPAILSSHEQKSGWPGRVEPELVGVVEPQTRLITTNMAPHKDEEAMDLTAKKAKAVATIILQDESPKDSFISAVDNAMDLSMKVSKLPLALTTRKSLEVNSSDADCKDELPREEVPLNFSKPKNILSKRLSSVETADFAPNNDCDIALQKRPKLHSSNSMLPKKWYKDPAIGCQPAVSLAIPRQPPPAHVKMAKNHSLQRGNAESKLGDDQSAHQPLAQGLSSSSTPIPQQHYHTNQHTANLPIHSQPSSAKPLPALFDSIPGNYPVLRGVSVRPPKNTSAQNAQSGMNLSAKPNLQQRWSGGHTKLEKSPNVTVSKLGNVIAPNPSGLLNNQIGKLSSTYSTYSNIAMSHHDSIRMMRAGGQSFSGPPMGQPLPLQHSRQQTDPLPYAHMAMDAARPLLSPPTYPAAGDPRLLSPSMCMMYMGGQDPTKQYPRPPPGMETGRSRAIRHHKVAGMAPDQLLAHQLASGRSVNSPSMSQLAINASGMLSPSSGPPQMAFNARQSLDQANLGARNPMLRHPYPVPLFPGALPSLPPVQSIPPDR